MLVLSRKKGDSIIIQDNIEIKIIEISGDQVKIGIKAPKDVSIHRKEIHYQIKEENKNSILNSNHITDISDIKKFFK